MKKKFYSIYYVKLDEKEIKQAVELDLIDDNDEFEEFCFQSKNKELLALFPNKMAADDFQYSMMDDFGGFVKVSDPIYIIREVEIDIDEKNL